MQNDRSRSLRNHESCENSAKIHSIRTEFDFMTRARTRSPALATWYGWGCGYHFRKSGDKGDGCDPYLKNLIDNGYGADAPGSIPGRGVFFFHHELGRWNRGFFIERFFSSPTAKSFVYTTNASIAQLAEHLLRKEKVTSSILVGGCGSHGLVGYDARLTRERSRVRASVRILPFFFRRNKHWTTDSRITEKYSFLPLHHAHLSHCSLLI